MKAPATLLNVGKEALKLATLDVGAMKLSRIPNSVDTLSPNNRFVKNDEHHPDHAGHPISHRSAATAARAATSDRSS